VRVFLPIYCENCYAPFGLSMETGIYTHPLTECLLNDKRYRTEVGSHGQITVGEI
jgi:hypothetical protein